MGEGNRNERIIETCRRIFSKRSECEAEQENPPVESECVLLCKRVGPNLFDIKNGTAQVLEAARHNNEGRAVLSFVTRAIFIVE